MLGNCPFDKKPCENFRCGWWIDIYNKEGECIDEGCAITLYCESLIKEMSKNG